MKKYIFIFILIPHLCFAQKSQKFFVDYENSFVLGAIIQSARIISQKPISFMDSIGNLFYGDLIFLGYKINESFLARVYYKNHIGSFLKPTKGKAKLKIQGSSLRYYTNKKFFNLSSFYEFSLTHFNLYNRKKDQSVLTYIGLKDKEYSYKDIYTLGLAVGFEWEIKKYLYAYVSGTLFFLYGTKDYNYFVPLVLDRAGLSFRF